MLWCIKLRRVVHNLSVVHQCLISMGTAFRNIKHPAAIGCEFDANPLPVGFRLPPQIDNDIEDLSHRASNQFYFLMGVHLEMHSSNCPLFVTEADIGLDEPID